MIVNNENSNEFIYYWIKNHAKVLLKKLYGSTFLEISKVVFKYIFFIHPSPNSRKSPHSSQP